MYTITTTITISITLIIIIIILLLLLSNIVVVRTGTRINSHSEKITLYLVNEPITIIELGTSKNSDKPTHRN